MPLPSFTVDRAEAERREKSHEE
ncbi:uncharacterized protein G2W53_005697 [Senna tora]|uniref:Uncharacterized protein n=1 Tax=Senna tora TaxID=362788 RepID=A0A834X2S7_9FABA|nr:uncharacterized protein G2W53_005697 [Senna tora]